MRVKSPSRLTIKLQQPAMQIGSHVLRNNLFVAPMAGVTDRPFRQLCKKFGAGLAVSEMVASNSLLWGSEKTRRRANHEGEVDPISVQIAGADPKMIGRCEKGVERGPSSAYRTGLADVLGTPGAPARRHPEPDPDG